MRQCPERAKDAEKVIDPEQASRKASRKAGDWR